MQDAPPSNTWKCFSNKHDRITYKGRAEDNNFGICLFSTHFPIPEGTHMTEMCSCSGLLDHADPSSADGTNPVPLHIALPIMERSKEAIEELLLILAPYFSSLNSLLRAWKSNIGYSIFPCDSLPEEMRQKLPFCPPPENTHVPLHTDEPGLQEETISYHHMNDTWFLPA